MDKSDNKYEQTISKLSRIFFYDFNDSLNHATFNNPSILLKYVSAFYRQWHYSSLIDNSIVTPANIMNNFHLNGEDYYAPKITMKSKVKPNGFEIIMQKYDIEEHPIYKDLKQVVSMFIPDLELDLDDMFKTSNLNKLLPKLSISDPFYAEYLLELSFNLELIEKMPSLYSNKVYAKANCDDFFDMSPKEKFTKIVEQSYRLTSENLTESIKMYGDFFKCETIEKLLKSPISVDELYAKFYSENKSRWTPKNVVLKPDDDDIIGETSFVLGILLDKYFFSVYGYFLKLIDPVYIGRYDFDNVMDFIQQVEHSNLTTILHSPCAVYSLTPLGIDFYELSANENMNDRIKLKCEPDEFIDIIESSYENNDLSQIYNSFVYTDKYGECFEPTLPKPRYAYMLKVKMREMPSLWRNVEIIGNMPLCYLHLFISDIFCLEAKEVHEFYMSKQENPFTKFVSPTTKTKKYKTTTIPIDSFDLKKDYKFIYKALDTENPFIYDFDNDDENFSLRSTSVTFDIMIMSVKESNINETYPKIHRTSAELKQLFEFN